MMINNTQARTTTGDQPQPTREIVSVNSVNRIAPSGATL
jgi:hypothetical protein